MPIDDSTLRAVTHEVCRTTFGLPIADRAAESGASDPIAAEIHVNGEWNARISVVASKPLARRLAGRMFEQDDETVEECDVEDSLCEFANIIGGNLKGIVGREADLSIPSLIAPGEATFRDDCLAAHFEHEDEPFGVLIENN